jgi:hypothetical protein
MARVPWLGRGSGRAAFFLVAGSAHAASLLGSISSRMRNSPSNPANGGDRAGERPSDFFPLQVSLRLDVNGVRSQNGLAISVN